MGPLRLWQCFLLQPSIRLITSGNHCIADSEFLSPIHYRTALLTKAIIKQSQPCKINMHDSRELEKKVFFVYFPSCWLRRRYVLNVVLSGKYLFIQSLHSYLFFCKKTWSKQPIYSLGRKYVLCSSQWKIYDYSQWPFIVYSLAQRID